MDGLIVTYVTDDVNDHWLAFEDNAMVIYGDGDPSDAKKRSGRGFRSYDTTR